MLLVLKRNSQWKNGALRLVYASSNVFKTVHRALWRCWSCNWQPERAPKLARFLWHPVASKRRRRGDIGSACKQHRLRLRIGLPTRTGIIRRKHSHADESANSDVGLMTSRAPATVWCLALIAAFSSVLQLNHAASLDNYAVQQSLTRDAGLSEFRRLLHLIHGSDNRPTLVRLSFLKGSLSSAGNRKPGSPAGSALWLAGMWHATER